MCGETDMDNMPLVSIIMPVYNADAYLAEAIDSVLAQTYQNWELIMVDDGSRDKSGEICDEYACRDVRIRVIHQENQGASAARNTGIEMARGEWIQFFDDDDILLPCAVQTLVEHSNQVDMVVCGYEEFPEKNIRRCTDTVSEYAGMEDIAKDFPILRRNGFFNPQWNKLYRRDCLGARFDPTTDGSEDVFFSLSYLPRCKRVCVIPDALIRYRLITSRVSLGNRFIMHFPQITEKTWYAFEHAFNGNYTVMRVISKDLFSQIVRWILYLVKRANLSEQQKLIMIETYVGSALSCKRKIDVGRLPVQRKLLWQAVLSEKPILIYWAAKLYR